jgi:hypothetical protein
MFDIERLRAEREKRRAAKPSEFSELIWQIAEEIGAEAAEPDQRWNAVIDWLDSTHPGWRISKTL